MTVPSSSPRRSRSPRKWRRRFANLLMLVGVGVLLYLPGTWGFTWWQQGSLAGELTGAYPALAGSTPEEYFVEEDMTLMRAEQGELVKAGVEAERLSRREALRQASLDFSASLQGKTGEPFGRLLIPKIGLDVVMIEGIGTGDLRKGPGHWPETPAPGAGGNFIVSGHRTTYGAPFFKLNELKPGDEIQVVLPYAAVVYKVSRTIIVLPTEVDVVAQRGVDEISLTTCEPIYSAARRLIVQAELSAFKLVGSGGDSVTGS